MIGLAIIYGPAVLVFIIYAGAWFVKPRPHKTRRRVETLDVHPCEGCPEQ
jgi:hypothetical protein